MARENSSLSFLKASQILENCYHVVSPLKLLFCKLNVSHSFLLWLSFQLIFFVTCSWILSNFYIYFLNWGVQNCPKYSEPWPLLIWVILSDPMSQLTLLMPPQLCFLWSHNIFDSCSACEPSNCHILSSNVFAQPVLPFCICAFNYSFLGVAMNYLILLSLAQLTNLSRSFWILTLSPQSVSNTPILCHLPTWSGTPLFQYPTTCMHVLTTEPRQTLQRTLL